VKKWVVAIGAFVVIFLIFTVFVIVFAFTKTKPTAEKINQKLTDKFQKIVRIPTNIVIAKYTFDSTLYIWEMTTPQNEAVPVSFTYNPDFLRNQEKIQATLEMVQGGDPSIFDKVSSAVIADKKTLKAVQDTENADFSPNEQIGYTNYKFFYETKKGKVTKIVWEFEKRNLIDDETENLYTQLNSLPPKAVRALYEVPRVILGVLQGA